MTLGELSLNPLIACQENATSLRTGNPQQGKIYIMISFIVTNNKLKGDASLI